MVMILFLLAAYFQPAKAEQADRRVCINRAIFDQALGGERHPYMITFPKDLSRAFIIAWNAGIRGFAVPVNTDSVSLYEDENDMYRVAFFKSGCLIEAVDVPADSFWAIIKMASGPARMKI
jgi:hypothetical protein